MIMIQKIWFLNWNRDIGEIWHVNYVEISIEGEATINVTSSPDSYRAEKLE